MLLHPASRLAILTLLPLGPELPGSLLRDFVHLAPALFLAPMLLHPDLRLAILTLSLALPTLGLVVPKLGLAFQLASMLVQQGLRFAFPTFQPV